MSVLLTPVQLGLQIYIGVVCGTLFAQFWLQLEPQPRTPSRYEKWLSWFNAVASPFAVLFALSMVLAMVV